MAKKTKEAEDEQELREAFRVFDKNNRGVIDVSDLKLIFQALDPDMPGEEVEQIISEVDEDGSGTVDFEGNLLKSYFQEFSCIIDKFFKF
jgi:calmodulin